MALDDSLSKTMATQERNVGARFIRDWFVQSCATVGCVPTFRNSSNRQFSSVQLGTGGIRGRGSRKNEKEQ